MARLGYLEVKIKVNGKPLPEYEGDEMQNESPDLVAKYIEATSGAQFGISCCVLQGFPMTSDAIAVQISLDGKIARIPIVRRTKIENSFGDYKRTIEGAYRNEGLGGKTMPFMFTEIKHTEQPSTANSFDLHTALSTIQVKIFHAKITGSTTRQTTCEAAKASEIASIPEHKLKGMSLTHTACVGPERSCPSLNMVSWDRVDGDDAPFAQFVFKYCSRKALQDLMLVPRTPSPVPLERRPFEQLSPEEIREAVRRYQAAAVKAEPSNKIDSAIKTEQDLQSERVASGTPVRGMKRERDPETHEILASARVKKVKNTKPPSKADIVEFSDGE